MRKAIFMSGCLSMVLASTVVLPGCGSTADSGGNGVRTAKTEKVKMLVSDWLNATSGIAGIADDLKNDFNARPDISAAADVQHIPGDLYYPKLNAGIAANEGPDIFTVHAAGKLETYVDAGAVMPLDDALNQDPEWKSRFTFGAFNLLTYNGKIYGIPTTFSAVALFYNKAIFQKYGLQPPQTYDELKRVVQVLKQYDVTPFAFGAKEAWTSALFSELVANRIGGDLPYNEIMDGKGTWLDPSYPEAGKVMQELQKMGAFPDGFLSIDNTGMTKMFKNGQAAMLVTGSWAINSLTANDSAVNNDIDIVKFPAFPNGKGSRDTWLGQPSFNFAVSSKAKDKAAAIAYVKMWTEPKYQKRSSEEGGDIPATNVRLDLNKVPVLSQNLQRQMSTMKSMFIFYDVGLGPKIGDEYNRTIQSILAGKAPEEAFRSLQAYTEKNRSN